MTKSESVIKSLEELLSSDMDDEDRIELASRLLSLGASFAYDSGVSIACVVQNVRGVYDEFDHQMPYFNPFDEQENNN